MVNLILRIVDRTGSANVGGPPEEQYRTIAIESDALEDAMSEAEGYVSVQIVGAEIVKTKS